MKLLFSSSFKYIAINEFSNALQSLTHILLSFGEKKVMFLSKAYFVFQVTHHQEYLSTFIFFFSIKFEKINLHEYDIIASSQASLNSLSQRGKEIYQKRGKKLLDMHEYTNYLVGTHFSRKWEKERSMGLCHWNFNHIILVWSFFRILYRDKCMRGNDAKIQDANPFLLRNISPLWVKVVLRSFACEI